MSVLNAKAGLISSRIFSKKSKTFLLTFALACTSWALIAKGGFLDSLKGTQAESFEYIHYSKSGEALWRLEGRNPSFLANAEIAIEDPKLLFYSDKGDAKISAKKAVIDGDAEYCKMTGDVLAHYQNDQDLSTQEANIDLTKESIHFPKAFKAKSQFYQLRAERGTLNLKPQKELTTSGYSELDYLP